MTVYGVRCVAVLGAGNMGHGIAEVAAMAGDDVTVRDVAADVAADGCDDTEWSLEASAEKVERGRLGRRTGRGYYDYPDDETPDADGADYEPGDGEGFDTLRVEARMVDEAARLVGGGVATPESVDAGVRLGLGFPEGICRRADELGLDVVLDELESLREETGGERFTPDDHLVELVADGRTGREAGAGFDEYGADGDASSPQSVRGMAYAPAAKKTAASTASTARFVHGSPAPVVAARTPRAK